MTDLVKKLKLFGDQLDSAQQKVQFYFLFFFLSHSLSLFHVSRRQSRWSCPAQPLPLLLYFGSVLAFSAWLHIAVVGAAHLDNLVLKSMARAVSKVLPFTPFSLSLSLHSLFAHCFLCPLSPSLSPSFAVLKSPSSIACVNETRAQSYRTLFCCNWWAPLTTARVWCVILNTQCREQWP